jgi:hypothetical protein
MLRKRQLLTSLLLLSLLRKRNFAIIRKIYSKTVPLWHGFFFASLPRATIIFAKIRKNLRYGISHPVLSLSHRIGYRRSGGDQRRNVVRGQGWHQSQFVLLMVSWGFNQPPFFLIQSLSNV